MRIHYFYCSKSKQRLNDNLKNIEIDNNENENETEKKFQCSECDEIFDTFRGMKSHVFRLHKMKRIVKRVSEIDFNGFSKIHCVFCFLQGLPQSLPSLKTVLDLRSKMPDMEINSKVCPVCKFKSASIAIAERHYQYVHLKKFAINCPKCFARASSKYNLVTHFEKYHPNAPIPKELANIKVRIINSIYGQKSFKCYLRDVWCLRTKLM